MPLTLLCVSALIAYPVSVSEDDCTLNGSSITEPFRYDGSAIRFADLSGAPNRICRVYQSIE
ncbi:hypothetical protein CVN56_26310 [Rhodococcus sp. AQ5-07]|nr:hypothetical protein CVN56_26310 [Rhodococcus sp. AQ5-07]